MHFQNVESLDRFLSQRASPFLSMEKERGLQLKVSRTLAFLDKETLVEWLKSGGRFRAQRAFCRVHIHLTARKSKELFTHIFSDIDRCPVVEKSLMVRAAKACDLTLIRYLVTKGVPAMQKDRAGIEAMDIANEKQHTQMRLFLRSARTVSSQISELEALEKYMAMMRSGEIPEDAYVWLPLVRLRNNAMLTMSPLHAAAIHNNARLVQLLHDHGAYINELDVEGGTPLHTACRLESIEVAKLLLERGAIWRQSDKHGKTPLMLAKENALEEIVAIFTQRSRLHLI